MTVDLAAAFDALDDLTITGSDIPPPGDWARAGRCRTAPPNLFFPVRGGDVRQAKDICTRCPVLDDCRAYSLAHPQLQGVWGGLTGRQRRAIRGQQIDAGPDLADAVDIATPERETVAPNRGRPRQRHHKGALYRTLAALAETHPGRWARVGSWPTTGTASTIASLCRTGRRTIPPGTWTFEARRNDGGGSDLYARYDGVEAEAAS